MRGKSKPQCVGVLKYSNTCPRQKCSLGNIFFFNKSLELFCAQRTISVASNKNMKPKGNVKRVVKNLNRKNKSKEIPIINIKNKQYMNVPMYGCTVFVSYLSHFLRYTYYTIRYLFYSSSKLSPEPEIHCKGNIIL